MPDIMKPLSEFIFGEKPSNNLPDRVLQQITNQQAHSEKLITWVQLTLMCLFSILYSLTPQMLHGNDLKPVPWALSVYFTFTIIRLGLAYRGYLPNWFLTISVIMDMALLMVLIWSFHIQYEQPPSFYLKAPTIMYVFIFIALRALRFEARYIILSGIAAAIGWSLMMFYVIYSSADAPMITRDYITYMTSNAILIGAEVDKIISILLVTAILTIAVIRAERIFHRAVIDNTAAEDLSRFVSSEVAKKITSSDHAIQPGDGESRVATTIFTDIEGFTTVSERLSPTDLSHMLNEYFGAMAEIIEKHGGVITQYEGDLILITFNAITSQEDHARNAMMTALAIQDVVQSRTFGKSGEKLLTRCGINTGDVIVGAVGSPEHLVMTVHGDSVNIAARLEQLNKQYGTYILAGENTAKSCEGNCEFRHVGEVTVRGRETPTNIYTPEEMD